MLRTLVLRKTRWIIAALVLSLVPCTWGAADTGVRVNHLVLGPTTSAAGQSPWKFSNNVLTLTGENTDYILSGKNLKGDVRVEVKASCLVTLQDFELDVSSKSGKNAIAIVGNHTLTLNLEGTSKLQGAVRGCGILVLPGSKLVIQSDTGTGRLTANGGTAAAGIGGEYYSPSGSGIIGIIGGSCGEVTVRSGTVIAQGGSGGAGIGGGGSYTTGPLSVGGDGGIVRILGGNVVASGGTGGAGIGGGQGIGYVTLEGNEDFAFKGGDGGTVDISGGSVTVRGGGGAAAIGGGQNGHGGTLRIHDGTVGFLSGGARDVGAGSWERVPQLANHGTYQILGGSVSSSQTDFRPKNPAGLELYQLKVPWSVRNATPILSDLTMDGKYYGYAMNKGTTADESAYFLWLPSGEALFAVGGAWYHATIRESRSELSKIETTFNALGGRIVYAGKNDTSLTLGTYKPQKAYGQLPAGNQVTRNGYAFAGWYDDQGHRVVDSDIVPTASRTLTAKWLTPIDPGVAVGSTNLKFSAYRNRPELQTCTWFGQSEVGYSNGNALRTGTIGHDATNVLQCIVTGPGTVSFRYKVSSEYDYDELRFHIASEPRRLLLNESGETGSWKLFTGEVPAGQQTLVWTYTKDFSGSVGEDCAYLDDIRFTPIQTTYSIRFIRNDGAGTLATNVFTSGVSANLPTVAQLGFARRGYDFGGWATTTENARNGVVWRQDGAVVKDATTAGQMMDAYAIWKLKTDYYEIRFEKNDGTGKWRALGYEYGKATALPSIDAGLGWSRAGYTFKGWATSPTGSVWKSDKAAVSTAAAKGKTLVLYAIWEKSISTYSIRFIRNDGAGTLATNVFACGVSANLPTVVQLGFARRGYTFGGWATTTANARNGVAWKQDGAVVKDATTEGKMLDIYAIWKLKADYYEIRFEKNDGTGKWRALGYEYGKATALPSIDVGLGWTRPGYTFKGWATSATGAVWKTDKAAVSTAAAKGKTLVIYAIWAKSAAKSAAVLRSAAGASASASVLAKERSEMTDCLAGELATGDGTYLLWLDPDPSTGVLLVMPLEGDPVCESVTLTDRGQTLEAATAEGERYWLVR